jgi:hypothetical protein
VTLSQHECCRLIIYEEYTRVTEEEKGNTENVACPGRDLKPRPFGISSLSNLPEKVLICIEEGNNNLSASLYNCLGHIVFQIIGTHGVE